MKDNILYYHNGWPIYELSYIPDDVRIPEFKRDIITPPGAFQHFTHSLLHSESIEDLEKHRILYKDYPHITPEFNFKPLWKFLTGDNDGKIIRFQSFQFHDPQYTTELNDYRKTLHDITYNNHNIIPNEYTLNPLHIPYVCFMGVDDFDYEIIIIDVTESQNLYTLYCLSQLKYHAAWGGNIDKSVKPFLYDYQLQQILNKTLLAENVHKYKRTKIIKTFRWESLFLDLDQQCWEELYILTGKAENHKKIRNSIDNIVKMFIYNNIVFIEELSKKYNLVDLLTTTTQEWKLKLNIYT